MLYIKWKGRIYESPAVTFYTKVEDSHIEGNVSQIFYLCISFYFILKNGYFFKIFQTIIF